MSKVALITGVTGQDGSYMVELLLSKQYSVVGIARRTSVSNTERIQHLLENPNFKLREADMGDFSSLLTVFQSIAEYDRIEVYNLAAQSHVQSSFAQPEYTADVNAMGVLRLMECIRFLNISNKTRLYQASTSELYGKVVETPQRETTPFYPRSPYGVAKLYAYWIVKNYRESYEMFACNGILFNHESERRGKEFVTRKITLGVAKYLRDSSFVLEMGNIDTRRDWGYAPDYVEGMWRMLQQDTPDDYVLATGTLHTVRECITEAFAVVGVQLRWEGVGVEEKAYDKENRLVVQINPDFHRPCEVDLLMGDASRALSCLGWKPTISFPEIVRRMVNHDVTN
jgi:GDPmannose 4,6-dehydratase